MSEINVENVDFSVVLVSTNQLNLLKKYLHTLFQVNEKAKLEVACIDNACTDGTADWVKENFKDIVIVRNNIKKSYSENMNLGMNILKKGKYFVVFNPDIQCLPGLWDESLKFMNENPDVGIMGPCLLNADGSIQYSCRRFSTPLALLIRGLHLDSIFLENKVIKEYLMLDFGHNSVKDVDWVMGALMVVRREAIEQVGGMDERYKITYAEDQDWCCRMWQNGWRVSYVPIAKAIHCHQRDGMRKPWSKMARIQTINTIMMLKKYNWKLSKKSFEVI
ncbi:MAG: glycosyltransferase family 2 protein [Candidatus Zhuqueibacterota bacterium]